MKEVTLWRVDLEAPEMDPGRLAEWVDAEEKQQARRFVRPRDGHRFLVRRAARRALLAAELGQPISSLRFVVGPQGKPVLADPAPALHFNATHSGDQALIATSWLGPLGVDLERHVGLGDEVIRVSSAFAQIEQSILRALTVEQREQAFFSVWTRKEALVKAVGLGLSRELNSFVVPVAPEAPPQWVHLEPDSPPWWLQSLEVSSGFSAALASPDAFKIVWRTFSFC